MTILNIVNEKKENITLTFDTSVVKKLKELREKKKLKKISPLINELLKQWIKEQEEKEDANIR